MLPTTAPNHRTTARHGPLAAACRTVALCALLALSPAGAGAASSPASSEAETLVRDTVDELLAALHAQRAAIEADPAQARPIVRDIVLPHVDLDAVSRLVLGKHWKSATPEQRTRFQQAFETLLVRTYSGALADAADARMTITGSAASDDGAWILVRSQVEQDTGPPVQLAYRLSEGDDGWRVIDISVGGVSLVSTWRSEFGARAGQRGIGALIDRIAERNAAG